jgi:hypothetical protein
MAAEIVRDDPPLVADERSVLLAFLDYHRDTLRQKCAGLNGGQMVQASVLPSELSLLGLVQHMTYVEWWWFEHTFANDPSPEPISTVVDRDADFHALDPDGCGEALDRFMTQCAHSRSIVNGAATLEVLAASTEREPRNLRWILVHMVEEYARHNGHADLLRQRIDGVVGE